jgi:uncharacterized membrane protein YjjP (DUF1212 family)
MQYPPPQPRPATPHDPDAVEFIVEMARALCQQGTPAHRLETAMTTCAERLGIRAEFFATPTAVFASIGEGRDNITRLVRVDSAEPNLDRLAQIDLIVQCVSSGELSPADGRRELREALRTAPPWPAWAALVAFAVAAGSGGVFFGGGWREVAASSLAGLAVGVVAIYAARNRRLVRVLEFAAGVFAAVIAVAAASSPLASTTEIVVVSGLIVLLPGLSITMAVSEVASRHIVSGSARLIGAATTLATIAFGVAAGTAAASAVLSPAPLPIAPLPVGVLWVALAAAPVAVAILFQASASDIPAITTTAVLGFFSARIAGDGLGTTLGTAAGALVVGLISNARAVRANRPVAVCAIPGIILLVPGSIGFRSLTAFLEQQTIAGLQAAVLAASVALGLSIGLLLANVLLPPTREL